LAANLRNKDLLDFFTPLGKVRDARIIADRNSRRSKGVIFLFFSLLLLVHHFVLYMINFFSWVTQNFKYKITSVLM